MIREQNNGLASELGGYLFKPRINKKSLELSSTMKSLHKRLPEMMAEQEKTQKAKKREAELNVLAECTYTPTRMGQSKSDKYLSKMGRKKLTPDELIAYQDEKNRRVEMRKQILDEVENKECTFKPTLSEKTKKIHEQLKQKGTVKIDPITKTMIASPTKTTTRTKSSHIPEVGLDTKLEEGPMLVIESEHPYRHNTNEFTTVQVPGAVQYAVSFHLDTKTEPVYDYIKFYDDDTHTQFFGSGKYSGGTNNSPHNWPGIGDRPPLIIPASKFIINFKTNGSINDWGFRMHVVPTLLMNKKSNNNNNNNNGDDSVMNGGGGGGGTGGNFETISLNTPSIPNISDTAKRFVHKEPVYQRLYKHGITRHNEIQNSMVDLMQNKLNITLKPWELARAGMVSQSMKEDMQQTLQSSHSHAFVKMYGKTHLPKMTLTEMIEDMICLESPGNLNIITWQSNVNNNDNDNDDQSADHRTVKSMIQSFHKSVMVVEFDDSISSLWKKLRLLG
jgi:hypothetical protein